jgi:hypothetical protein
VVHKEDSDSAKVLVSDDKWILLLFAQTFLTAQSWQQNELLLFLLNNYDIDLTINSIDALSQTLAQVLPVCDASMNLIPCQKFVKV